MLQIPETALVTINQPFNQVLLYLRAAGHDTGAETRARLQHFVSLHCGRQPSLSTRQLLEKVPQWFDLPDQAAFNPLPPMTRGSVGYPDE
jgi:hypothetical protein